MQSNFKKLLVAVTIQHILAVLLYSILDSEWLVKQNPESMLVPPANFGIVEDGIYRCSKIENLNFSFIETLKLKTVIFVNSQEPSKYFKEFFKTTSIRWIIVKSNEFNVGVNLSGNDRRSRTKSSGDAINQNIHVSDPRENTVEKGQSSLSNSHHKKGKVHDYILTDADDLMLIKSSSLKKLIKLLLDKDQYNTLLVDRTSVVVGILRKTQKWGISSIINEYRLFAGKNRNYFTETFLEILQISIVQERGEELSSQKNPSITDLSQNSTSISTKISRNSQPYLEIISEEDLCKVPEVPTRIRRLVNDVEARFNSRLKDTHVPNTNEDSSNGISPCQHRSYHCQYALTLDKRSRGEYEYYKCQNSLSNIVEVTIPVESRLPEWFTYQRDFWEQLHTLDNTFDIATNLFVQC